VRPEAKTFLQLYIWGYCTLVAPVHQSLLLNRNLYLFKEMLWHLPVVSRMGKIEIRGGSFFCGFDFGILPI